MEVREANYRVWYDTHATVVHFSGEMDLTDTQQCEPVANLLDKVRLAGTNPIILNVRELTKAADVVINMFSKFALETRKNGVKLVVQAAKSVAWQESLTNLKKLNSNFEISYV